MAQKKYVDQTGLTEFLAQLKLKYAANSADAYVVNYAKNAGDAATAAKAFGDAKTIQETYLTKVDAASNYVAKDGYVAYSQAEKTKLAGIAEGAEVNVLEAVAVKGESIVTMSGKTATIDLDGYAKKSDIASVLDFKGVKATVADLPTTAKKGDVWIVTTGEHGANEEYVCTTSAGDSGHPKWEALGATIDLSGYATKTYADEKVAAEAALREAADNTLDGKITALDTAYKAADAALDGRLDVIEGADTVEGSIKKAVKDEATARDAAITAAINGLDVTDITGPYFTAIGETDGKIHATAGVLGSIESGNTGLVTGGAVYTAIAGINPDDHTYAFSNAGAGEEGTFHVVENNKDGKVQDITVTVNADKNKLESVKVNGSALTIDANKAVDIDMSAYADQTLVANSAEPCSSKAVLAAGFAYDADIVALTTSEIDSIFA